MLVMSHDHIGMSIRSEHEDNIYLLFYPQGTVTSCFFIGKYHQSLVTFVSVSAYPHSHQTNISFHTHVDRNFPYGPCQ